MRGIFKVLKKLKGKLDWLSRHFGWIAGGLTMVMMVAVMREVVGRYFFNAPSDWSLELCGYLLVGLAYLAAADTEMAEGHIRIDFLYERFKGKTKKVMDIVIACFGLLWSGTLIWQGGRLAFHSLATNARSADAMMWPLFPSQIMVPIGSSLLFLALIGKLVNHIGELMEGDK
jgi:TRAP-type mannitol/chloroaromatic compound transport system permease small subunit